MYVCMYFTTTKKLKKRWVSMAYVYNPSFSGDRDQEDCISKPAWTKSSRDPILKIPNTYTQRVGDVAQVVECLPNKHEALSSNSTHKKTLKNFVM
jgi:hypothetical protein